MKSAQTTLKHGESDVDVAAQLIKEVSESIVARNVRRNKRKYVSPLIHDRSESPRQPPTAPPVIVPPADRVEEPPVLQPEAQRRPTLAIFCYQEPETAIGKYISGVAPELAKKQIDVHFFTRAPFGLAATGIQEHVIGECPGNDLLESIALFTHRIKEDFIKTFGSSGSKLTLLAHEWTGVPAMIAAAKLTGAPAVLSLHSLECQRSDLSSELSRKIQESELQGLECAQTVLIHDGRTAAAAERLAPQCRGRIRHVPQSFPIENFSGNLDAGEIKRRHLVGPVDPMILFVGNLDDAHGADLVMKAAPAVLKNNKQARFVFVGDGTLQWPLRVHARYLLLEHAVRILGHLEGQALHELIQAADVVVVPSRSKTEEWPILAAWAAKRAVVATHNVGSPLIKHEQEGVLVYSNENSCVWGIERMLYDENLRKTLGENGHKKLREMSNWNQPALQIEKLVAQKQAK